MESLHERIARALGWTVEETQGFSLLSLRDLVGPISPKLAHEITLALEDLTDCFVTPEQTREELEELESQLARIYKLEGSVEEIRQQLISLNLAGQLVEDELVADWHGAYASFLDWQRHP
jgi:hypothetical protein